MKKIVIQENQFFNRSSWQEIFETYFEDYSKVLRLEFTNSQDKLYKQLTSANCCFCFNLKSSFNLNDLNLELFYLGISDLDFKENYNFPKDMKFYSSKGVSSRMIAEYTLMASLMLIRKVKTITNNQSKRKWDQSNLILNHNSILSNYKIGVIGLGNNGLEIANIFNDLGCEVVGLSRNNKKNDKLSRWYSYNQLNEILDYSDIIIIALPLNQQSQNLISKKELEILGEKSFIINISRGEIVHENDLIYSLNHNIINGAVIDVASREPIGKWSKLWKTKNLIITPHISGNINSFKTQIQTDFVMKLKNHLKVK